MALYFNPTKSKLEDIQDYKTDSEVLKNESKN